MITPDNLSLDALDEIAFVTDYLDADGIALISSYGIGDAASKILHISYPRLALTLQ